MGLFCLVFVKVFSLGHLGLAIDNTFNFNEPLKPASKLKKVISSRGIISSISLCFAAEKKRNQTSSLPPGHHAFQFSFKIPSYSLPSSFESKHGYVRYWLKARIHRPWRFDEVTKELVKILSLIDVNCPRILVS